MAPIPKNFELCFSKELIASRVAELGREISIWVEGCSSKPVIAIGVLRGAVFFYADLLRVVPAAVDVAFLRAAAYMPESNKFAAQVKVWPDDIEPEGRSVLLIDDICDSGATLKALEEVFLSRGADQVRSAVAIHRGTAASRYQPTWTLFHYPGDEWFAGYGMDTQGEWRNLPNIYRIIR